MSLYKMPIDGGNPVPLTDSPGDEFEPRWSPDGREIAYYAISDPAPCGMAEVMLVGAEGGSSRTLACSPRRDDTAYWSPDGLSVAFRSDRTGRYETWLVSRDSIGAKWGEAVQLTDTGVNPSAGFDWAPDGSGVLAPSPGGGQLFLIAPDRRVLWRHDLAGENGLTLPHFRTIRYSRDGRSVYFSAVHRDGRAGIWAIPVAGGPARQVIAFDDPAHAATLNGKFSIGPERLYLTVSEYESDIWVANLRY